MRKGKAMTTDRLWWVVGAIACVFLAVGGGVGLGVQAGAPGISVPAALGITAYIFFAGIAAAECVRHAEATETGGDDHAA